MEVIDTTKEGGRSSGAPMAIFFCFFHLTCDFPISRFENYSRETNKVTHELAKLARFSFISEWFKELNSDIVPILINDVIVIPNE